MGKSTVFRMYNSLTSHGSSKSKKSRRTAEESRIMSRGEAKHTPRVKC